MNYGIQYLAHLVQIKNDLNRKRRRFYHLANPSARNDRQRQYGTRSLPHKSFSREYAKEMYKLAKLEMKAMTPEMRRARKEINASLTWTSHGAIGYIIYNDQRYTMREVARFAELWRADAILLGENYE